MINIIDYEMGNLRSVEKAFEKLGYAARVSSRPEDILTADKVVLPGVGAFRDCVDNLRNGGFVEPLLAHVAAGKPLLGICVGMQMLFDESEEFGVHKGLGLIPGRVVRFPSGMLENGERLWETNLPITGETGGKPVGSGTAFVVKNGDRFFLASETGHLIIAHLSPKGYDEVGRWKMLEPTGAAFGRRVLWSHPAFAHKCIFARNDKELICASLAAP